MENNPKNSDLTRRFEVLQQMAVDLISVRHPKEILTNILKKAADLLICDAGSLYIKHNDEALIFEVSVNHSLPLDLERKIIPLDVRGIATYSFSTGQPVALNDVYKMPPDSPYVFDTRFDEDTGYRTKSMIVYPLISSKGERLGVIQLINRKHRVDEKWPLSDEQKISKMPTFSKDDQKILQSFAALASATLENALLYKSIENLFEGFVYAAVGAIESRDRATRGHSERVAILSTDLAHKVNRSDDTSLREIRFNTSQLNELRYAALLHDFGKIGVREQTLMKSEKLHGHQCNEIRHRLNEFTAAHESQELRRLLQNLIEESRIPSGLDLANVDRNIRKFKNKVDEYWDTILDLNQPTILDEDKTRVLIALQNIELMSGNGTLQKLLQPNEVAALSIKRGSLNPQERLEIEEHVTRTYLFLREIPWTKDFANVADIAHAHHEKLDGTGYPRHIHSESIPVQSRIMTICDIFDALVASDRPYKRAVPVDKALDILSDEVKAGKLDARLFKLFLEAKVFENLEFLALTGAPHKKAA